MVGASANSAGAATCLASDNGWLRDPLLSRSARMLLVFVVNLDGFGRVMRGRLLS